ncbi:hypothetical protein DXG03_005509 [Asterophora parasitica]|uniref:Uncharacterized protein n=1 Tax=Asterophora parasitica TaxID=117018 RepID=A0A9P7KBF0_9AGAR|nr:hypothetical protein DXG03_005509 [Asterophora parasitica]
MASKSLLPQVHSEAATSSRPQEQHSGLSSSSSLSLPKTKLSKESKITVATTTPVLCTDAVEVYSKLLALGAPGITGEDFARLYHGPLAEILVFVGEIVKGRRGVARDRRVIEGLRACNFTSIPRHEKERKEIEDPTRRAHAILGSARRTPDAHRAQLAEREALLAESPHPESQLNALRASLTTRKRTVLLLRVLEEREKVRVEKLRVAERELGKMRDQALLEASESASIQQATNAIASEPLSSSKPSSSSDPKIAQQNLHALHLRLARLLDTQGQREPSALLTSKLRQRLAKVQCGGGIANAGKDRAEQGDVESQLARCSLVAHGRARRTVQFHLRPGPGQNSTASTPMPISIGKAQLDGWVRANRDRKTELQVLSDHAVALGSLCEHFIASLIAERWQDPKEILRAVEGVLQRSSEHAKFTACLAALRVPAVHTTQIVAEDALITSHDAALTLVEDHARAFLGRKVEKAALGEGLLGDMEGLMRDVRTVVESRI